MIPVSLYPFWKECRCGAAVEDYTVRLMEKTVLRGSLHHHLLTLAGLDIEDAGVGHHTERASEVRDDVAAGNLAVLPCEILNLETAATTETADTSAWPCRG